MEADRASLLAAIAVSQRQPLKAEGVALIVVLFHGRNGSLDENALLLSWNRE
jgi:hypothetical protein